jgi:hypothetical protein
MNWTPEQIKAARDAMPYEADRNYPLDRQMVAIMDSARDALAANGGTMTAEVLEKWLRLLDEQWLPHRVKPLRAHIAAQGAKVAELKASADELERQRNRSNEALEVAEGVRDALRATAAELEAELGEWKRGSHVSFNENKALKAELDAARVSSGASRDLLTKAERQLAVARLEAAEATKRLRSVDSERNEAAMECERLRAELGDVRVDLHEAESRECSLKEDLARERARKWVQCTSVSNECLGGCRTMAEHDQQRDRQRDAQLRADVSATEGESLRGAVLRVVKERQTWESEARGLAARLEALATSAELARLKPSGQVAEDVAMLDHAVRSATMGPRDAQLRTAWIAALSRLAELAQRTQDAEACAKMAGEDQDRLSALAAEPRSSLVTAESQRDSARHQRDMLSTQLLAIRERATDKARIRHEVEQHSIMACVRWVVDGDASEKHPEPWTPPESVDAGKTLPQPCVIREEGVPNPCEDGTCGHENASPNTPETVAAARGAAGLPEVATARGGGVSAVRAMHPNGHCTCAGEGVCAWCDGLVATMDAYDEGAEAMRAACWEAVQAVLQAEGYGDSTPGTVHARIKAAIVGATP